MRDVGKTLMEGFFFKKIDFLLIKIKKEKISWAFLCQSESSSREAPLRE